MVSSNWLITNCESNRLIFRTFESIDKAGNITEKLGWMFGDIGPLQNTKKGRQAFDKDLFNRNLTSQIQNLERYNAVYEGVINRVREGVPAEQARAEAVRAGVEAMVDADDVTKRYVNGLKDGKADIEGFEKAQRKHFEESQKQSKGLSSLGASTKAMLGNIAAGLAVGLGITALTKFASFVDDTFNISNSAKVEDMTKAINDYDTAISETSENISSLKNLETEFNALSKGVDENGRNISLSAEQYERYNEIVGEIASISPEVVQGYTSEGNAIVDRNTAIQEGIKLQQEYANTAREAYTTKDSMNAIVEGAGVDFREAFGSISDQAKELGKVLGDIGYKQVRKGQAKKTSTSDIVNDVLGEEVDLESINLSQMEKLVKYGDQIVGQMKKSGDYTDGQVDSVRSALTSATDYWRELETAAQPVYDNLLAWVSTASEDSKSMLSSIPEELQGAFQTGLQTISMQSIYEGWDATKMRSEVRGLSNDLKTLYSENETAGKNFLGYKDALETASEAQKDFTETGDFDAYNEAIGRSAESLYALADAQEEAGNTTLAEALRAQASEISDYANDVQELLADAFNPYTDKFKTAAGINDVFTEWREGITDYADGIESYKTMLDSILDDSSATGGNGSMAFWKAAELSIGEKAIKNLGYDVDAVQGKMNELRNAMADGSTATDYFYNELYDNMGQINKVLGKEAVWADENGISFNIDSSEWAAVADTLGIAEDSMMALLSAATQYSNIDLSNTDAVRNALKTQETTFTKDGVMYSLAEPIEEAARQSLGSIEAAHRRIQELNAEDDISLISLDVLKDNMNYSESVLKGQVDIFKQYQQQAKDVAATFAEIGYGTASGDSFIFDADGIRKVTDSLLLMGGTADDVYATLKAWRTDPDIQMTDKLEGMDDEQLRAESERLYSDFQKRSEEADPLANLTSSADTLTDAINRLTAAMGGIPDIQIDDNLDEIQDKIDRWEMAKSPDEKYGLQNEIENEIKRAQSSLDTMQLSYDNMEAGEQKNTLGKQIKDAKAELVDYQRILKDIKDDGEINGSIKLDDNDAQNKLDKFKEEMDAADNKDVTAKCKTVIENQDGFENFLSEIDGITNKEKKIAIKAVTAAAEGDLSTFVDLIDKLPEDVQTEVLAAIKNPGELEGFEKSVDNVDGKKATANVNAEADTRPISNFRGELNSLNGQQAQTSVTADTSGATGPIAAVKSALGGIPRYIPITIAAVATGISAAAAAVRSVAAKAGGGAKGTSNRRKQSHFPSMAKGGRIGPTGNGGLTLTGELGTELVWLPDESTSFLVGQYGPEMVDLPANAVIYPADETRRIIGDTLTPGRLRFGSMASGSYRPGSSGGGSYSPGRGSSSSSGRSSGSSSSSSSSNNESAYEKELKALQHQLEMGYITEATYYTKLNALYKKYSKELAKNVDDQREALEDLRQAWIDAYEEAKDSLDHQLEMGTINEEQYYNKLKALGDSYYKNRKGYTKEYEDHLEELKDARKDAYDAQLEDLDKSLEKETITLEQYYQKIQALQKKWLSGKEMANDLEDAVEDMYDAMQDALDKMYDDLQQQIEDNDLFNLWIDGGDTAVDMLKDFRNQMEKDGRKYFETEKEWREWLLELDRDIAEAEKDQAEEHKDQLDNVIDLVEDMIRQEAEDYIDALEDQKDAYADIIDAKKKALKLTEDELAYQKEMNNYAKDISKLQSQIELLSRDDSRAAAAQRAELEEQLAELLEEQQQAQRDETLSKTEDALDDQLELFEELVDKQIESVENWLNNQAAVLDKVMEVIENRETNNLLERLIEYNGEHGDAMLSTVNEAWDDITNLANKYGNDVEKMVEILQKGIDVNVTGGIISVDQTDYQETQDKTQNKQIIRTHHNGLATGFTGDGADLKQHEVYRRLTDDELVLNRNDQMRLASQLDMLDTIKTSFDALSKGIDTPHESIAPSIDLVVNAPITIEGNASDETVREIKQAISDVSKTSMDKLSEALRIRGVRSRAANNVRKN